MIAIVNTFIGVGLSLAIGMGFLGLTPGQVGNSVLASEVGGLIALLGTLQAERRPWVRKHLLNRSIKTWIWFLTLYFGSMFLIAPPLREPRILAAMIIPLALGNGLTILIFGPIQDWIVRREQRRVSRA